MSAARKRKPLEQGLVLAFDRSIITVRTIDHDGRMHVELSNISKAMVSPYLGREIPNYQALGLEPQQVYQLLRDPAELARAAPTFNKIQLLEKHTPVSAKEPQQSLIVGSTGSDAAFNAPYLVNSLVVWAQSAIDDINSGKRRELSCGYRYRADMTPGVYEGVRYDGVMRDIVGNHVALVEQGRAGSDVVVGDSKLVETSMTTKRLSRKATLAKGALAAFLQPLLAQDAKIDWKNQLAPVATVLAGTTAANWKVQKPIIIAAVTKATTGKLAQDADLDQMPAMLDSIDDDDESTLDDPNPGAGGDPGAGGGEAAPLEGEGEGEGVEQPDPCAAVCEFLSGKISDEDLAEVKSILGMADEGQAVAPPAVAPPATAAAPAAPAATATVKENPVKDAVNKQAMDAAIAAAVKKESERLKAINAAKDAVRPLIGEIAVTMDSAAPIYKLALDQAEIDLTDVPEAAYPAMVAMLAKQKPATSGQTFMAADAATAATAFAKRYPAAVVPRVLR